ncbi:ABC transporter permease [Pediococcus pentosaceus]|uniref:ABC transporter permease n=1 Tax=Pediococcus pentosaceus TaxID=1255 RepID=A0ABD7X8A5_PEDPE|nr:ABC transporter permease [Pediococcus pentosaceus]MCV3330266.1 ABC transporter permease [Pediococcus pentosaceus]MDE7512173.1 ABC transporter permease [Pediococcus pentosaceus]WEA57983.1 ABC transporter permease [Pediococcus pentosaceus]WRI51166.1 ABC transporter permease [Pediococcus pentosaceus]SUB48646.1 Putrescine transport system permease protein PotH [Pediococcus pentosaceus]
MIKNKVRWMLVFPGMAAVVLLLFFPLLQMIIPTFSSDNTNSSYTEFLSSNYNQEVIFRTVGIAVITTIIVLILGLPLELWISRQKGSVKKILSIVILFPILTNAVVRNFTWIIILGKNGVLNELFIKLHIISNPLSLLYTNFAIVVGLVYLFLPIMVTSLVGSIDELNIEVEEAAAILGASPSVSFFKVIIPQLITGVLTGCILVFAGSMTAYTTPQILGGNRHLVMATLIYQESMTLGDWNSASIVAVILIVLTVISIILMRLITRRINRGIENA